MEGRKGNAAAEDFVIGSGRGFILHLTEFSLKVKTRWHILITKTNPTVKI